MATPTISDVYKQLQVLITTVSSLTTKIDNVEKKLAAVEAVSERIGAIEKEVTDIRSTVNHVDQDARACIVRVSGLVVSEADMAQHGFEKAIIKKVYDRIIKPILSVAKNNGIIESVPTMLNVLEQGFIASRGGKDKQGRPLPPILGVRFTNRFLRNTVMRLRREHTPTPTDAEKVASITRYFINEDLTPDTMRKVRELRERDDIDRVWTIDGRIRFTIAGDSNTVIKLPSPYVSIENYLQKK
jgi:uncharacterized protein YoxC